MIWCVAFGTDAKGCSMYKLTILHKTMVGCNEDAWRLTSRVWFETKTASYLYGAAFTGSREDGANGIAPQSGMNEQGLAFSRLASPNVAPPQDYKLDPQKKKITNPTLLLKDILHQCKTVEEVQQYINQYDYSYFQENVFIYIDQSGNYLVVEPYVSTIGKEAKYILSNFCPSATLETEALKLDRYRKGVEFVKDKIDTTLSFCTALSASMHVCRPKIGDGTLLTSIWDLDQKVFYLYFYHNYNKYISFNLQEELAKGNHSLAIPPLFSPNKEFEQLANYVIPQNNLSVMLMLMGCAGFLGLSALYFFIRHFSQPHTHLYPSLGLVVLPIHLVLIVYMAILALNMNIFYFAAPYQHYNSIFITLSSYTPFGLLIFSSFWLAANTKIMKNQQWHILSKLMVTANSLVYVNLLCWFIYWRLFGL